MAAQIMIMMVMMVVVMLIVMVIMVKIMMGSIVISCDTLSLIVMIMGLMMTRKTMSAPFHACATTSTPGSLSPHG